MVALVSKNQCVKNARLVGVDDAEHDDTDGYNSHQKGRIAFLRNVFVGWPRISEGDRRGENGPDFGHQFFADNIGGEKVNLARLVRISLKLVRSVA
jgi:hypothetical protein